jgi:hypothetical protein
MRLEGLGQLKKSTSSGLEPATFRSVAKCLNQLRYRVPPGLFLMAGFSVSGSESVGSTGTVKVP